MKGGHPFLVVSLLLHVGAVPLPAPAALLCPRVGACQCGGRRKIPGESWRKGFVFSGGAHPHIYDLNLYSTHRGAYACCVAMYIVHVEGCK